MKTGIANLGVITISFIIALGGLAFSEEPIQTNRYFEKAADYEPAIPAKVIRKIKLPEGYHEGLFLEGDNIWVNNGEGGKTWVIDLNSGAVVSEIEPPATFTEGISAAPDGKYWVTDWDTKKLYLTRIKENKLIPESEIFLGPDHPTGVIWTGGHFYAITWTRGAGTRYYLLKMDGEGNILEKARIKDILEPSQLAWDGKNLWISSWFQRRVYRIDPETFEISGYFRSHIEDTTGIVWDGKYIWVTGTKADLHQMELLPSKKTPRP